MRLVNSPNDYLIVEHFRGSKEDTELQIGGDVWCKIVTRIREQNGESPGDLQRTVQEKTRGSTTTYVS